MHELNGQGQCGRIKADEYQQVQKVENKSIPSYHHQLRNVRQVEDSEKQYFAKRVDEQGRSQNVHAFCDDLTDIFWFGGSQYELSQERNFGNVYEEEHDVPRITEYAIV